MKNKAITLKETFEWKSILSIIILVGAGNRIVEVNDLGEAKRIAEEGIAYTQTTITIENLDGEVIIESRWSEVEPDGGSDVLKIFGGGYYKTWSDELENRVY